MKVKLALSTLHPICPLINYTIQDVKEVIKYFEGMTRQECKKELAKFGIYMK